MWADTLKTPEAEFTQRAINVLNHVSWAKPVLSRLAEAGGIKSKNMPLMFEVRFAYELHRAEKEAEYEYKAGVGGSTVEFKVLGDTTWLIELVSIRTSQAAKNAILQHGLVYEQLFHSNSEDIAQREEAEMITAEQKIGEKVFKDGVATKFPLPQDNIFHVILIDIRGYLDEGGDIFDYRQMAYGASGIPSQYSWMIHYWETEPGKREPIKGLFEKACPLKASQYIRERIHFLGFICECDFCENEIPDRMYYLRNPHLLSNGEAMELYKSFPLVNPNHK